MNEPRLKVSAVALLVDCAHCRVIEPLVPPTRTHTERRNTAVLLTVCAVVKLSAAPLVVVCWWYTNAALSNFTAATRSVDPAGAWIATWQPVVNSASPTKISKVPTYSPFALSATVRSESFWSVVDDVTDWSAVFRATTLTAFSSDVQLLLIWVVQFEHDTRPPPLEP